MKAIPFVNNEVRNRPLKYYIFDWDDNILHMPTKIRMERLLADGTWRLEELSTSEFARARKDAKNYRAPNGDWNEAFRNFEDQPGRDTFMEDTIDALEKVAHGEKPGPSYNALKKSLREGRLFAIVTARGHSPETIERAVRVFIQYALTDEERAEMLSNLRGYRAWFGGVKDGKFGTDAEEIDKYLSVCHFAAVTYPGFKKRIQADPIYQEKIALAPNASRPELAKEFAIREFVEMIFHLLRKGGVIDHPVSIGFSDDDKGNVKCISDYIRHELSRRFKKIKFVVYDTSDRTLPKGRKVCVSGQSDLPGL